MHRVLIFDGPKARRRFELLRIAVLSAGDGKGERTRDTVRKEARLLDALDAVSLEAPTATDPEARTLMGEGSGLALSLRLAQSDYELLSHYADTTPWNPRAAREAVDLQDWVGAADKVDE